MFGISLFKEFSFFSKILLIIPILAIYILRCQRKKEERKNKRKKDRKKERKKEREKESKNFKKCTSMASTNCYKFNIHPYRFCVSYIGVSVSRVGPTRTAYSIFCIKNALKVILMTKNFI